MRKLPQLIGVGLAQLTHRHAPEAIEHLCLSLLDQCQIRAWQQHTQLLIRFHHATRVLCANPNQHFTQPITHALRHTRNHAKIHKGQLPFARPFAVSAEWRHEQVTRMRVRVNEAIHKDLLEIRIQ